MLAWGAPPEAIEQARARIQEQAQPDTTASFGVYPENMPSVLAFIDLRTQWRYAGDRCQRIGFDYAGISAWLNLRVRPRLRRQFFEDLQTMEAAVLLADQELRDQEE